MSDEMADKLKTPEFPRKDVPNEGRSVSLTITLHPNGQVEFNLPNNSVVAHGMLGLAQAQLVKLAMVHEAQQAQASRGGVGGLLKRMNGGRG